MIYFAGDLHLGAPSYEASQDRLHLFCSWLEEIAPTAQALYLMGDVFDFWFPYKRVVPKGYVRLFASLLRLTDKGIAVHWLLGNHDLWADTYWEKELDVIIHPKGTTLQYAGQYIFVHHGHTLGPLRWDERLSLFLMQNKILRHVYRWIHPDIGLWLGHKVSARSRHLHHKMDTVDLGPQEYLHRYVQKQLSENTPFTGFIFGHRHLAKIASYDKNDASKKVWMVITGDWITQYTYAVLSERDISLWRYTPSGKKCLIRFSFEVSLSV